MPTSVSESFYHSQKTLDFFKTLFYMTYRQRVEYKEIRYITMESSDVM